MAPECGFVNYRHESAGEPAFFMNALNGIDIGRILSLENGLQATASELRAPLMESDLFTSLHDCGSRRLDEIALLLQAAASPSSARARSERSRSTFPTARRGTP